MIDSVHRPPQTSLATVEPHRERGLAGWSVRRPRGTKVERLKFGIAVTDWGLYGDPRRATELAGLAEATGWDGYSTWDARLTGEDPAPSYDPWVGATARRLSAVPPEDLSRVHRRVSLGPPSPR